jgi:hypothetical protein
MTAVVSLDVYQQYRADAAVAVLLDEWDAQMADYSAGFSSLFTRNEAKGVRFCLISWHQAQTEVEFGENAAEDIARTIRHRRRNGSPNSQARPGKLI